MSKYGGVYSDLDTITLKSFKNLLDDGKNGIGYMYENYVDIGIGVLVFQKNMTFINYLIDKFSKTYSEFEWGINGPILFAKSLLDFCDIENIHRHLLPGYKEPNNKTMFVTKGPNTNQKLVYMNKNHKCSNIQIFPEKYFYPLFLTERNYLNIFDKNTTSNEKYWKAINNSYSMHYFGKISAEKHSKADDKSFYSVLASIYCDYTFDYVKKNNLVFF